MDTIYKTPAGNGLIPQAGRSASTFPSGLIRIDQTYLGLTANAAAHRAALAVGNPTPDLDDSPSIYWTEAEGGNTYSRSSLKIFPNVQETKREDGFTEYKVSAYGRVNETGTTSRGFAIQKYSETFSISQGAEATPLQYTVTEFWEIETITFSKTIPSSDAMGALPVAPATLFRRLRSRRITGSLPGGVAAQLYLNWSIVPLTISRVNYGHIDELSITYGYE